MTNPRHNPVPLLAKLPCQVCGRRLTPLKDGTARRHGHHGACQGSGYRLAPWEVGQHLRHYAGGVWEVIALEPYRGTSHDWMTEYRMRCIADPHSSFASDRSTEGRVRTFHGEYMHRHGWVPDLMRDLERSLTKQKKERPNVESHATSGHNRTRLIRRCP